MRKFLIRCIIIFTIVISPFIYLYCIRVDSYPIPMDRNILILGDSHTECAINDSILSRSFNLSRSSDAYIFSLINLRAVLNAPNNIDTLLLSFWSQSLSSADMQPNINDLNFSMANKIRYANFSDLYHIRENPFCFLPYIVKYTINPVKYNEIGNYLWLDRDKLQENIADFGDELKDGPIEKCFVHKTGSQYNSLLKIRALCEAHNIELILFNSPTYKLSTFFNTHLFETQLRDSLEGFTYVDFSDFNVPDSCYGDIGHLNYKGARIFSEHLQEKGLFSGAKVIKLERD